LKKIISSFSREMNCKLVGKELIKSRIKIAAF
jgi:hypothetical protein